MPVMRKPIERWVVLLIVIMSVGFTAIHPIIQASAIRPKSGEDLCGDRFCGNQDWRMDPLPVNFWVNPNTADVSGEEAAVTRAFDTWVRHSGSEVYSGYRGLTTVNQAADDGINAVFWSATLPQGCETYGACAVAYDEPDEFDIVFNDNHHWSLNPASGSQSYDIESVTLHEVGHVLGLAHHGDSNQVMAPSIMPGQQKRALAVGDQNGVRFLYPPIVAAAAGPPISASNKGGYWLAGGAAQVREFGDVNSINSLVGSPLNKPIVGMAATSSGRGYWLVGADGGVFAFGDAPYRGSVPQLIKEGKMANLNAPVVGIAATPSGQGYWLVAADGGIFNFGDAPFKGSMGGKYLAKPIVGMAATTTGQGYWLVGADGGVFPFGDAPRLGSLPERNVTVSNIVGIAADRDGSGYYLASASGQVFTFDAVSHGSMAGKPLNGPIIGIATDPDKVGYWLVGRDGGVFSFQARFYGSVYTKPIFAR